MDDELQFKYKLFLEQNKLFESFIGSGAVLCTLESPNIDLIVESLNSTVNEYISKVLTSAQTQWDRYKNSVGNKRDLDYLKKQANSIKNSNPTFSINNFPNYSLDILTNVKIQPFNYALMKDSLATKNDYMQKYYSNLTYEGKPNIKEGIKALCFKDPITIKCDKKVLVASYNFCVKNFYNSRNLIEADLKIINNSSNSILTALNTVQIANEAANLYLDYKNGNHTSIITEAPTTPNRANQTKSMSFSDDNGDKTNMNDKKAQKQNQSFLKSVNIYMDVSMSIISTKMKLLQEIYNANMNVVKYFVEWTSKGAKKQATANKNGTTNLKKQIDL